MSKNIPHPDFIDAYLKNKLSEAEMMAFERRMQQDPLLQNEVNLQRDIVNSLAEVRRAELKAKLDALPVDSPVAWYSLGHIKWMAAAMTAATLSMTAYWYFSSDSEELHQPVVNIEEEVLLPEIEETLRKPVPAEDLAVVDPAFNETASVQAQGTISAEVPKQTEAEKQITSGENEVPDKEAMKLPEIIRPNVVTEFDDDFQTKEYDDVVMPEKALAQVDGVNGPNIEIENQQASGYDFHYRYQDNKLFLYGDFKGIPYEILALNTDEKTRLFLKYDSSFYVINPFQTEITPLLPIQNQALINELKIVSNYK